jgi:hypothetical protein
MKRLQTAVSSAILAAAFATTTIAADQKSVGAVKGMYLDRSQRPEANGLTFEVELERADGSRMTVPTSYEFHTGDRIRLQVQTRKGGYLYALNRTVQGADKGMDLVAQDDQQRPPDAAHAYTLLLGPVKVKSPGTQLVPDQKQAIRFDEKTGIEKLFVIVSDKPLDLLNGFDVATGQMRPRSGGKLTAEDFAALDRILTAAISNCDCAIPPAPEPGKGLKLEDAHGYGVERQSGIPVGVEISLRHSN